MSADPTDLEPTTFLAKQAIRSVARLGVAAVGFGRTRLRARELDEALRTPTFIDELLPYEDDLKTGDSAAIVEFLTGDEVERLHQWVAALQISAKWDEQSEAALVGRLSGGILKYTNSITVELARTIASHLAREISTGVSSALGSSGAFDTQLGTKSKRALAKNAALVSRLSMAESTTTTDLTAVAANDSFIDSLLRSARQASTKSKMPHLGNLKSVPLADLYVAPSVAAYQNSGANPAPTDGDILVAARHHHRLVILGDPGGGKTTSSRRIMNLFSEQQLSRKTDRSVAIMVVLRDWARELASGQMTVIEVLARVCSTMHSLEPPEGALEELLTSGRVRVFFDGLDELLETADRSLVVDVVEGFVHRFPLVSVVVTSRRVGYPQAPLDSDLFHVLEISQFSSDQRRDYVTKWFSFEDDLIENERAQRSEAFLRETDNLLDIAANPLMLSLMCALYSYDQYIPRNRPEVYEKCSRLMFDSWDRDRGIHPTLSFQSHMMGALDSLALYMYRSGLNEAGLARTVLVERFAKYLKKRRFRTIEEARAAASNFVDHCSGRAWILSEISPERYTFTHATFIEYFAARQMTRKAKSPKRLSEAMRERVLSAEWDVVCQLAVQIVDETEEDGSDKVVRALLRDSGNSAAQEVNLLSFVVRCFDFYVPSPQTLDVVADRVVKLFADRRDQELDAGPPLEGVLEVGAEIRGEWHRALFERIEKIGPTDCSPSLRALVVLEPVRIGPVESETRKSWREVTEPIREEWRIAGVKRHPWCILAGRMSFDAVETMARSHGVSAFFADWPIGRFSYQLSMASRLVRHPRAFDPKALQAFSDILMTSLSDGPLPRPDEKPFGLATIGRDSSLLPLDDSTATERTAVLCAGIGLVELAGEVEGISRNLLVPTLYSGGEASFEGGTLQPLETIGLDEKVLDFAERWMRHEFSIFSTLE